METQLSLRYHGPTVDGGTMNVYSVATNLVAFSDFVVAAARVVYGEKAHVRAEVAGFGRGSFVTDLAIQVAGTLPVLFAATSIEQLLSTMNAAIELWKHLRGSPPQMVEQKEQGIHVTNRDGEVRIVQIEALNLTFNGTATEAAGKFIREALSTSGVDGLTVEAPTTSRQQPIVEVSSEEASSFVPVAPETDLFDSVSQAALIIEAPVFKDGNKWRFSDGASSFWADITDTAFLQRVEDGEPFAKGDVLIVDLQTRQRRQADKILTDKIVVLVREHRQRSKQQALW